MPSLYLLGEQYISRVYIRLKYRSVVGISQKKIKLFIIIYKVEKHAHRFVWKLCCIVSILFAFVKQRCGIDGILNEITKIVNNFDANMCKSFVYQQKLRDFLMQKLL